MQCIAVSVHCMFLRTGPRPYPPYDVTALWDSMRIVISWKSHAFVESNVIEYRAYTPWTTLVVQPCPAVTSSAGSTMSYEWDPPSTVDRYPRFRVISQSVTGVKSIPSNEVVASEPGICRLSISWSSCIAPTLKAKQKQLISHI